MTTISIMFLVLAAINLPPVIAAVFPPQIQRLYGVAPDNKTLITLLQHRAILLGIVGVACVVAAYVESFRWPALWAATISMVSFLILCGLQRQFSGPLRKIAIFDAIGLPALIALFVILPA